MESTEVKILKLNKYIEIVEQAVNNISEKARRKDFSAKSEEEIRYHLSHDPDMIAEAGLMLAEFRNEYENAKFDTKVIHSEIWRRINDQRDVLNLTNAKDREAYVLSQPEYKQAIQRENEWKYRTNQMEIVYDRYQNLFVAMRKLTSLITEDTQNSYRRVEYGSEPE